MNLKILLFKKIIPAAFIILFLVSCAVNPVTGKREFMLLSESQEIELGKQTDEQVVAMYGIYDDQDILNYINELGQKMVKVSHRPDLDFEFKVMDSPVINAFAVPGGYVYITRGILAYLNNEAELAGVVGHEIGHVTARHSAKQYSKAQLAQLGLGLGSMVSETFAQYAGLAQTGVQLLFLKYSRDNERESDRLGVEYASKIGYDAHEMANFFETLDKMQGGGSGSLPGFLSTHPNPDDRVPAVEKKATNWKSKIGSKQWKVNRNEYLSKIHGIVVGDDPRHGYEENNVFYHPEMKFQFPKPAGWKLQNLPSQVQMATEDQKAAIIFSISEQTSPAAAANDFVSKNQAQVISQNQNMRVHGLPAHQMITKINSEQGVIQIMSYFIKKDNTVFFFHGFASEADFTSYKSTFTSTMNGFNKLTDQAKINVKPDRIRVKKIERNMSLRDAFAYLKVPSDDYDKLALMNGMDLNDNVVANTWIKTIEHGR